MESVELYAYDLRNADVCFQMISEAFRWIERHFPAGDARAAVQIADSWVRR